MRKYYKIDWRYLIYLSHEIITFIIISSEIHSIIHSDLVEIHVSLLLWISDILVNLVFELRVVLPLRCVLVHHWHVRVHYDLSVLLNGPDLAVQLL